MSEFGQRSELDLLAVQRDAEQLDALARRDPADPGHDLHDLNGLHGLLLALTRDVDEGLAELLATPLPVPPAGSLTEVTRLADRGRRRAARMMTATLLVTGLASVSGVAAAVTGDPLAPYRSVIDAVTSDEGEQADLARDANTAVGHQIRAIDRSIDAGHLGRARAEVARLRGQLDRGSTGAARVAAAKLAALEARLARAVLKDARTGHASKPGTPVAAPVPAPSVPEPGKGAGGTGTSHPGRSGDKGSTKPSDPSDKRAEQTAQSQQNQQAEPKSGARGEGPSTARR